MKVKGALQFTAVCASVWKRDPPPPHLLIPVVTDDHKFRNINAD